jgi:hypothetical protein
MSRNLFVTTEAEMAGLQMEFVDLRVRAVILDSTFRLRIRRNIFGII